MMLSYNEINALAKSGKKDEALVKFKEIYLPKKLAFMKTFNQFMQDNQMSGDEEIQIVNQFNNVMETLSMISEVDTIYYNQQQAEMYKLVGE